MRAPEENTFGGVTSSQSGKDEERPSGLWLWRSGGPEKPKNCLAGKWFTPRGDKLSGDVVVAHLEVEEDLLLRTLSYT